MTRPRAGRSGVLILAEQDINFSSKIVQTHNNFASLHRHIKLVPAVLIAWLSSQGLRLNTHLKLMPELRLTGDIPTLPLHAFMACTPTLFFFRCSRKIEKRDY
jgi:uncharacterized membrane protein (DUF441 family)